MNAASTSQWTLSQFKVLPGLFKGGVVVLWGSEELKHGVSNVGNELVLYLRLELWTSRGGFVFRAQTHLRTLVVIPTRPVWTRGGLVLQTLFLSVVIATVDNSTCSAVQHGTVGVPSR